MKPVIKRELDEIRALIADLEKRLKNDRVELGHREVASLNRKGEVPAPTPDDYGRVLRMSELGVRWQTISGTGGGGGSGTPDGHTLAMVTGVLNAEPLSGTIDARFKNLSGTIDGHFNALNFLSAVSHDSTLTGDGTSGSPLSASPLSGTINARFAAATTASQAWTQTANGTEGTTLTAVIPITLAGPQYQAFVTNFTGTNSPAYKVINKNSASFQVVSTAPFANGDKLDLLVISGGLGPPADVSAITNLSGTIDARFFNLSGTIDGHFNDLSGSINSAIRSAGAPEFKSVLYEDFEKRLATNEGFTTNTSLGSAEPGHPGILQFSIAASGTNANRFYTDGTFPGYFGDGYQRFRCLCKISGGLTSDGTNNARISIGWQNSVDPSVTTFGAYLRNDRSRYGDNNWRLVTVSSGTASETTTGVAATANWMSAQIEVAPAGNAVTGTVDGVATAVTTNIPIHMSSLQPVMQFTKTLGATARVLLIDYVEVIKMFTTSRF